MLSSAYHGFHSVPHYLPVPALSPPRPIIGLLPEGLHLFCVLLLLLTVYSMLCQRLIVQLVRALFPELLRTSWF